MIGFAYHSEILKRFPEVCGGVLLLNDVSIGPARDDFLAAYTSEQQAVKSRIRDAPLSEIESLAAWRAAFRAFGVDPTRYRSAAESLLRRLVKKGDIPSINMLVDVCNLISIRYALPVAAFDTRQVRGVITVRFAEGNEAFMPLDQIEPEHPDKGEVIFCDEKGLVVARRWCWKQSRESVVSESSRQVIITIEAQHPDSLKTIEAVLRDLQALIEKYLGGFSHAAVLGKARPEFSIEL
jgi:DNA/RNA-binding domain of Phe-tRNA-synthetase-like protein